MEINDALIDHLSNLSKLSFEGKEREQIKADLTKMLGFVEKLNELNVDGVDELIYLTESELKLRNDVFTGNISQTDALKNAPLKDSDYFKVPKFLGS